VNNNHDSQGRFATGGGGDGAVPSAGQRREGRLARLLEERIARREAEPSAGVKNWQAFSEGLREGAEKALSKKVAELLERIQRQ
jgi:hypothetical protein